MKECEVAVDLPGGCIRSNENSAKVLISVSALRSSRNWVRIEENMWNNG